MSARVDALRVVVALDLAGAMHGEVEEALSFFGVPDILAERARARIQDEMGGGYDEYSNSIILRMVEQFRDDQIAELADLVERHHVAVRDILWAQVQQSVRDLVATTVALVATA